MLDVRGNGIASSMAQEAVAAIEDSSCEVLLLEGNDANELVETLFFKQVLLRRLFLAWM